MNKYYSSSSYFVFEAIFAILICMVIGYAFFSVNESAFIKTTAVVFSFLAITLIIMYLRNIVFDIFYNENDVLIDYHLKKKKTTIDYSDLIGIKYIGAHKNPAMNRIKYKTKTGIKTKKFQTVAFDDQFVEFVHWIKSKNPKIKISVIPSDHCLNEKLFGPKYRKYVKETL
ncbi:MAG: hypothetical protein KDD31_08050 [Muricauda sp.]|nr:hypothetical protein [Allomuricauda sp.]